MTAGSIPVSPKLRWNCPPHLVNPVNMLYGFPATARSYLYAGFAEMRKSFVRLCGLVFNQLGWNPLSGDIFIFMNQHHTLIKILVWNQIGSVIYYTQLEKKIFELTTIHQYQTSVQITQPRSCLYLKGDQSR